MAECSTGSSLSATLVAHASFGMPHYQQCTNNAMSVDITCQQVRARTLSSVCILRNRRISTRYKRLTVQHCQSAVLGSRWAAYAIAGASAAAILAHQLTETPAACLEHPKAAYVGEEDTETKIKDFRQWLDGLGAQVDALNIRVSPEVRKPYSKNDLSHMIAHGKTAVQKSGHITTAQSS